MDMFMNLVLIAIVPVSDILDIHKHLMKKHGIKCLDLLKIYILWQQDLIDRI